MAKRRRLDPNAPPPPEPRRRNAADDWADATRAKCAAAIVAWMKGSLNPQRPIRSLTRHELECIAEAATGTWVVEASRRPKGESEEGDANYALLLM